MALSGSVSTSSYEGRYLTLSWTASQSIPNNQSTISWTLTANGGSSSYYYTGPVTVTIDGRTVYSLSSSNRYAMYTGTVASGSTVLTHNTDGTKSFTASINAAIYSTSVNCTGSQSFTLNPISGTAVTQTITSKTETSITVYFEADTTVDYAWYSTNGGATWIGIWAGSSKDGQYTISGLDHASTYRVRTKVKRRDTQTESVSAVTEVKTYSYPYATNCPNFVIGEDAVITIYNPIGREASVTVVAEGTTIINTTTTGTSVTIPSSSATALYQSIPTSTSGTYTVTVNYDNHPASKSGTYRVGQDSAPTLTGLTYRDTDSTVVGITGNNQKIVQGKSKVQFTATGISARNQATVSSVKVNDISMTLSGTTATVSNVVINSSETRTATVVVTDSRGLTASLVIDLDTVEYQPPTMSATAKRVAGYYSNTEITPTTNYTYIGSNAVTIQLQARKTSESSYTVTQTISSSGTTTVSLDNQYPWYILLTITDSFGGSSTFEITIGKGIPLFYFDIVKNSVSVDKFPEHSNSFEVNGDIYGTRANIDGDFIADFPVEVGTDSNGWTYRKWHSGRMEAVIHMTNATYDAYSIINGLRRSLLNNLPTLPAFASIDYVGVTGANSGSWLTASISGTTVAVWNYTVSGTVTTPNIMIKVEGRWTS